MAVSIIRHLRESGHQVVGTDCRAEAVGRHVCDVFHLAPPAKDREDYLSFLRSLAGHFDIFMPFVDEELLAIAGSRDLDPELSSRVVISERESVLTCTDKISFQAFAERHGLAVPPLTGAPPAFVKPRAGRGSRGAMAVDEPELVSHWSRHPDFVCQRRVEGEEYTVDALVDEAGAWVFGVARRRLAVKGVSVVGRIDMSEQILEAAREVVALLDLRGPVNVQLMREHSGRIFLMEVNPRLSGSVIFATLAGWDLLNAAIGLFVHGVRPVPPRVRDGLTIFRYWSELAV